MALPVQARLPGVDLSAQLVEQLRKAQIRIPPYPAVATSLERLSREPKTTVADVAAVVATDSALAAIVLRHAASVAMRTTGPVTLEQAVRRLGLDELTRVVIATTVGAAATARGPLAVLRRDQWRRSLLAAMFARELAPRRGVAADQAFLAGLLHDFGAIVVLSCLESLGTDALPVLPEATWRRLVEDHHVEHGMTMVARWQLPEPIAEVVASHHSPESCLRQYRPLVQLIAIVDQILAILDRPGGGIAALVEVPGLEHDERFRIGALMPKVAELMARFETPPERETRSPIAEPAQLIEGSWPVDFAIDSKSHLSYRATAIAEAGLAFRSQVMLQPAWLAELTLRCPPAPITMLVHVKTCRVEADGNFLVTGQPFGLAGDDEAAWKKLLGRLKATQPRRTVPPPQLER